jgi:alkylhydroperoxidase family enzyme
MPGGVATVLIAVALSACAVEAAPITEQATPSPAQHAAATEAPLVATVAADQVCACDLEAFAGVQVYRFPGDSAQKIDVVGES